MRFSVEVTEIFRGYLPEDERGVMRWSFHFDTRPEIRQLAITEAFKRMYPSTGTLPALTPRPATAGRNRPCLPSGSVSLPATGTYHSQLHAMICNTNSKLDPLPQITKPLSSSQLGHFTFTAGGK